MTPAADEHDDEAEAREAHERRLTHLQEREEGILDRRRELDCATLQKTKRALDVLALLEGDQSVPEEDVLFVVRLAADAEHYGAPGLDAELSSEAIQKLVDGAILRPAELDHIALHLEALAARCRARAGMVRVRQQAHDEGLIP